MNALSTPVNKRDYVIQCYNNYEHIDQFTSKLLDKGVKEKKLKINIKKLLKTKLIFASSEDNLETLPRDVEMVNNENMNENINHVQDCNKAENVVYSEEDYYKKASEILKRIEEKFSEYLKQFEKEWEVPEIRSKWVNINY